MKRAMVMAMLGLVGVAGGCCPAAIGGAVGAIPVLDWLRDLVQRGQEGGCL